MVLQSMERKPQSELPQDGKFSEMLEGNDYEGPEH